VAPRAIVPPDSLKESRIVEELTLGVSAGIQVRYLTNSAQSKAQLSRFANSSSIAPTEARRP
jgi:hypothetical protein